jgi:hypothetical protein
MADTGALAADPDIASATSGQGRSVAVELAPRLTKGLFAEPPAIARPKYRWWLPLAYTDDAELVAELGEMRDAGGGGAEIAAFGVAGAGHDQNPFLETYGFGTPKWVAKVETILSEANRIGLGVDLTIGPRWPATLPSVSDVNDPAAAKQMIFAHEFRPGGTSRSGPLPTNFDSAPPAGAPTTLIAAVMARCTHPGTDESTAAPRLLDRASVVDVTSQVSPDGSLSLTFPDDGSQTYVLIVFSCTATGLALAGFTPTGTNYALDMLGDAGSQAITKFYDATILTPAVRRLLRTSGRTDLFEDSLELGDTQKWTAGFEDDWNARRGYSAAPVLAALTGTGAQGISSQGKSYFDFDDGSGPRIRHDYRQTHNDLYIANHLDVLQRWAHQRSITTRIQPYGIPLDIPEVSAHIDVPEGETLAFGGADSDYSNIEDYKLISAGAHASGAAVVSFEACAYVGAVWATTAGLGSRFSNLRAIYRAFAGGVNQVVWHGFPYLTSGPAGEGPETVWPGMSYDGNASFSESFGEKGGPNWSDYRFVNDALARSALVLRQGVARFDCAVFWQDFGMNNNKYVGYGADSLVQTWSSLAAAGYTYEYLSPPLLVRPDATVTDRVLLDERGGYRALIVRRQDTMTVESAQALVRFAERDLPILVVGNPPSSVPGFDPSGRQDRELRDVIAELMARRSVHKVGDDEDLPDALRHLDVEPAATPVRGSGDLRALRRHTPSADFYLLINPTGAPVRETIRFTGSGTPYSLDAWTGQISSLTGGRSHDGGVTLPVEIAGGDVTVIAFSKPDNDMFHVGSADEPAPGQLARANGGGGAKPIGISSWSLALESWTPGPSNLPGDTAHTALKPIGVTSRPDGTLPSWADITTGNGYATDLADISGIGTYTANLTLDHDWNGVRSAYLDLGAAVDTVRVAVNGKDLPPVNQLDLRHVEVGSYLRPGGNTIAVRVASTLLNAVRVAPGTGASERTRMDYGLLGPVTLTPYAGREALLVAEAVQRRVPLARGGYNQITVKVTNSSTHQATVTVTGKAPDGIAATAEPKQVVVAAGETTEFEVGVRNASLKSGTSTLTIIASASNGLDASTTATLMHSNNLVFNPTDTPLPRLFGAANQDNHPHKQAVDGQPDTFWVSWGQAAGQGPSPATPVDFAVDFGASVTIGTVSLKARGAYVATESSLPGRQSLTGSQADYGPRDFAVQASNDGRNWTTITSVTDATKGSSTTTFAPVKTRYLRLHITATWDPVNRNAQIGELVVSAS